LARLRKWYGASSRGLDVVAEISFLACRLGLFPRLASLEFFATLMTALIRVGAFMPLGVARQLYSKCHTLPVGLLFLLISTPRRFKAHA
jgi:hypothetical protein